MIDEGAAVPGGRVTATPEAPAGALKLLLRLRWTLLLRNYNRSTKNQIGLALTALARAGLTMLQQTLVSRLGTKLAVSGSAFNVTVPAYTAVVVLLP